MALFSKMIVRKVTEDSMEKGAVVIPHSAPTLLSLRTGNGKSYSRRHANYTDLYL